ncbi:hypothetical protein Solca_1044 [Solitalea canadensis DSM 3403]|uniref:Esterase n=2 Tax=Solitalea canadensis TaxID=995 RepID=H8KV94_SOLCM|nr:hypothetical protein Solca_1044 [Solitalea canadensis DSM 3403]
MFQILKKLKQYIPALIVLMLISFSSAAQSAFSDKLASMHQISLKNDVVLTFDEPQKIDKKKVTKVIIYALPNGNTTAWTFGKKLNEGEDWHFNIQHIGAQTEFIRSTDTLSNYIIVYVENELKSWPAWRKQNAEGNAQIKEMVEYVFKKYEIYKPQITLSGHSGGGSFVFGYINSTNEIPSYINRIGFLDATYGYETEMHSSKLKTWLRKKSNFLQVISYNDSVVVYNGKPLVSPTGGTWYRSKLIAKDLGLVESESDSTIYYNRENGKNAEVLLLKNPSAAIFHTVLVEKNGFIHMVLNGTGYGIKKYEFWANRAYEKYIL